MKNVIRNSTVQKLCILGFLFGFLCLTMHLNELRAQPTLTLNPIFTSGLSSPMQVLHAGDGTGRMFVTERAGVIKVFDANAATPSLTTFLDLNVPTPKVGTLGEGGLLSIAFHPDYASATSINRGVFFAFYTNTRPTSGDLIIEKYKVADPLSNVAAVTEATVVLLIPHRSASNHNGGEMHFGPDGLLYVSVGDGGGSGDTNHNAQRTSPQAAGDLSYLLGKMLRIDVNNSTAASPYAIPAANPFGNEIFDYGLRNPFRWSFDRQTGDMWIGDVGQNNWEEIDFRAATTAPGVNYGWNCFEGNATYASDNPLCGTFPNFTPAYDYDGQSVIGGTVYRGRKYLDLMGYYVGTDYFTGEFQLIKRNEDNTAWVTTIHPPATMGNPAQNITGYSDIGEAANGELYAVRMNPGAVFQIKASGALPVTLQHFRGSKTIEGNKLTWQTVLEENFRGFEIEYRSDRAAFRKVGEVQTESNRAGASYQFYHKPDDSGQAYYRLKMVDKDESFSYSNIISIHEDDEKESDFVRPSFIQTNTLHVLLEGNFQFIELVGTSGNVLHKQEVTGKKGSLEIPIHNVPSGIYLVRLRNPDRSIQQKVLVTR